MLVLLHIHMSKHLSSWKRPFVASEKVSPIDYNRGREKVFHVNMLKL